MLLRLASKGQLSRLFCAAYLFVHCSQNPLQVPSTKQKQLRKLRGTESGADTSQPSTNTKTKSISKSKREVAWPQPGDQPKQLLPKLPANAVHLVVQTPVGIRPIAHPRPISGQRAGMLWQAPYPTHYQSNIQFNRRGPTAMLPMPPRRPVIQRGPAPMPMADARQSPQQDTSRDSSD